MIAKELARRGNLDVNLITFDHGQPHHETIENVKLTAWSGNHCRATVHPGEASQNNDTLESDHPSTADTLKTYLPHAIWHILQLARKIKRQFYLFGEIGTHSIWHSDVGIFDEVNADVYIVAGNGELTSNLVYYCKKRGKKFILLAGSDLDFDPRITSDPDFVTQYGVPGYLMAYNLKNTDIFLVQTEHQRELLERHFQRKGVVVRNPIDTTRNFSRNIEKNTILWVGKSDTVKRPELALDVAENLPQYPFKLILNLSNKEIYLDCHTRAKHLPNVTILTYVPYDQIEKEYAQAKLFLSTSLLEGFPNTFLHAAKYGVPIVSLNVDPGGMLSTFGCGMFCNGNFETIKESIYDLMTTPDLYSTSSFRCLNYVHQYHDKEIIARQYEEAILSLYRLQASSF